MVFDIEQIREQFPALTSGSEGIAIHLDNPGGTQVARHCLERILYYMRKTNANHGGEFRTSRESDAVVDEARRAFADLFNAARPEEIVFGANMTTLTLHFSRSISQTLNSGDEIVLTRLDHDANVAPWLLIAEERGCTIRWVDFDPATCRLALDTLEREINPRTKLVAIGYASNAVGTINDVQRAVKLAHSVGALVYIDAVQYAAHGVIDVQALDCDFLVCSAYKFFGPHVGVLYGKYDLLDKLTAYKVRTSSKLPPEKWETGTGNFEGIAGTLGALEYIQWLGQTFNGKQATRRQDFVCGLRTIQEYEGQLSHLLIDGLSTLPGVHIWGITQPEQLHDRVSTVSFTWEGKNPREVAAALGRAGIYVWNGNFYALEVTRRLGVEDRGGLVRVGAVHYNTPGEINTLIEILHRLK